MFVSVITVLWVVTVLSIVTAPRAVASQSPSCTAVTSVLAYQPPSCAPASISGARTFASTAVLGQFNGVQSPAQSNMTSSVKQHLRPALLREVYDFWFEHFTSQDSFVIPAHEDMKRWFYRDEELDRICVERFAPTLEAIRNAGVKSGAELIDAVQPTSPSDWLGLVLLLDQIPRNCYRGTSSEVVFKVFDPLAREVALAAIARGVPDDEPQIRWRYACRTWFYMPLMHSEELSAHEKAVAEYERMRSDVYALAEAEGQEALDTGDEYHRTAARVVRADVEAAKRLVDTHAGFEKKHIDIIKRFGRYPHRNKALGREATAEEAEYLANGGETFGS